MTVTTPDYPSLPMTMTGVPVEPLLAWARTALSARGYRTADSEPDIRRRDWSVVVALQTDRGRVWAKQNARHFAHEAGLLTLLAEVTPGQVLHPIAVDPSRGWFLTADGGPVLEDAGPASQQQWEALLTGYADLQAAVAPHVDHLLALGLPDMRPHTLADWLRQVLDRVRAEPTVLQHISPDQLTELEALIPVTATLAAELLGPTVPMTVEHNDLHTDNVFSSRDGSQLRIFDWGDAVVTHPFLCLGRALRIGLEDAGTPDDDTPENGAPSPERTTVDARALRDAYLQRWLPPGAAITAEVRRAAAVAEVLSDVALAASWLRLPAGFLPDWGRYFADSVQSYLQQAATVSSQRAI